MKKIYNPIREKKGHTRQACAMELYYKKQEMRKAIFNKEGIAQD